MSSPADSSATSVYGARADGDPVRASTVTLTDPCRAPGAYSQADDCPTAVGRFPAVVSRSGEAYRSADDLTREASFRAAGVAAAAASWAVGAAAVAEKPAAVGRSVADGLAESDSSGCSRRRGANTRAAPRTKCSSRC
jgi:hypothetical protein